MTFLNISAPFTSWNETAYGMLWAYNLNYMDWLNQPGMGAEEGAAWIDRFIADLPAVTIGLDPYPTALRSINWMKFLTLHPECATRQRLDALYSQVLLLERKLEYHLLGNHLLEDACALFISALFFQDRRLYRHASRLLKNELEEQILADGAHYEQSVMYHCILLDRLLDCVNMVQGFESSRVQEFKGLRGQAQRMIGWLKGMTYADGSYPLFNDAAEGIAPRPAEIIDYARRLGIESNATELGASGYRKLVNARMEALVDVGNIMATYQPGHTHADTFTYELRIAGRPFVVDTGISTYNKTERRQYERSTKAHNCVVAQDRDSSEVWGGFRVGRRCRVTLIQDSPVELVAAHDGYGAPCQRRFSMTDDALVVEDCYEGEAVSYIHLAEGADEGRIMVEEATDIEVKEEKYSTTYNRFRLGKVMAIHFKGRIKYTIR